MIIQQTTNNNSTSTRMNPLGSFLLDMAMQRRCPIRGTVPPSSQDGDHKNDCSSGIDVDEELLPRIVTDDCKGHHVKRMKIKPCRRQNYVLRASSSSSCLSSSRPSSSSPWQRRYHSQSSSSSSFDKSCSCCDPIRPETREQRWCSVPEAPQHHHKNKKSITSSSSRRNHKNMTRRSASAASTRFARSHSADDVFASSSFPKQELSADCAPTPCMRLPSPKKTTTRSPGQTKEMTKSMATMMMMRSSAVRRHSLTGGSSSLDTPPLFSSLLTL